MGGYPKPEVSILKQTHFGWFISGYPLVNVYIAIEHGLVKIVSFPIRILEMVIFQFVM